MRPDQCAKVPLETTAAKRIGAKIGECKHADVVDVQVALTAREYGAAVVTSDRDDILAVDAGLKEFVADV